MIRTVRSAKRPSGREKKTGAVREQGYYESLTEAISDAVISTDLEFKILSWNKGAVDLFGWKEDEVLGKQASKVLPTEYLSGDRAAVFSAIAKKQRWTGEVIQTRRDGGRVRVQASVSVVKDGRGRRIGYVTVNRDITERAAGAEALRRSEERYRVFVSQSTEGIWRFELEKPVSVKLSPKKQIEHFYRHAYLAECNDAMARMYGLKTAEELVGSRLGDMMPRNDRNIAFLEAFIRSGYRLVDAETEEVDGDGRKKYFLNNLVGVFDDPSTGQRAWGIQRDITGWKEYDSALHKSKAQLEAIFDSMKDGVVITDMEGNFVLSNGAQAKINKFASIEEMHTTFAAYKDLYTFWDMEGNIVPVEEWPLARIMRGESLHDVELRGRRNDIGHEWYFSFSGEPILDWSGKQMLSVVITRDITNRKEIERRKDEFIGMASHELKTPVTSLKVYLQTLQKVVEMRSDGHMSEHLRRMDTQLDKLTLLVRDLLDLSKIQAGKLELRRERFKIDDLVRESADVVQLTTDTHLIMVEGETGRSVDADRDRIGQVIVNLLTNAVKYSPRADKVVVSVRGERGKVIVSVRDYGIGIAKAHQSRVFDRFFRVEGTEERTYPGFGMGLYISAEIVRRHGGDIDVESVPGKGSTFSFSLLTKGGRR